MDEPKREMPLKIEQVREIINGLECRKRCLDVKFDPDIEGKKINPCNRLLSQKKDIDNCNYLMEHIFFSNCINNCFNTK